MKLHLPIQRFRELVFRFLAILALMVVNLATFAQAQTITGTVSDQISHETLPGASVVVKGTTKGAITDIMGNFTLNLASGENTLVVSYIGYNNLEVAVGKEKVLKIELVPSSKMLQEVVVIGYGTSKVKDLTSSITTVKSDDLTRTPSSQPVQALQGKVAGLQIISSGGPGNSSTVRLRGIGSFPGSSNEAPLYVVDGMFFDNIDFLNPNDIASISVLKDASASAIYGVRAANGVVLIETKSGNYDTKSEITYDGYYGTQIAQNVLQMANAAQFVQMAVESGSTADVSFIDNAMQRYGRSRVNPNVPNVNTDWYKEISRMAPIMNHSLNFTGGSSKSKYSLGASYFAQSGILNMKNEYERFNLRSKLDFKVKEWLTIGGNMIFSNATKYGDQGSAWNLAYFAVPILPVEEAEIIGSRTAKYANAQDLGYRSGQNPFPTLEYNQNKQRIRKLLANFYGEVTLIPKMLNFKTSINSSYTFLDERNVSLPFYLGNGFQNPVSSMNKSFSVYASNIWDNVLTFNRSFGKHYLTAMAGTSFRDEGYQNLRASGTDFPVTPEQAWYLSLAKTISADGVGDDAYRYYGFSYFGRLSYNFSERYLLYATMRADGTSKYQEKWGYFPTIGAGWVVSQENFFSPITFIDYLKFRASWGRLGNDKIQASDGATTTSVSTWPFGGIILSGTQTTNTFSSLKWEVTEETNLGFTARLIKNKLSADVDYFIRDTKNAAIPVTIPGIGGTVLKNVGVIRNKGFEVTLDWTNEVAKDFTYNVGINFSTLKNEVKDLYGQPYIDGGSAEFRQRTMVGQPLLAFFGREVIGVYQTQAEIDADAFAKAQGLVPGDLKYKDQNGDSKIDDDDRVVLGSYFPKFMYGGNLGGNYKGFDLSASVYGQYGNKILNRRRGEVIWTADGNMDADLANNRWHGEGTSDKYPSSSGLRRGWNQKMSDYFVEDGSFFRIQNVQVGYTLKDKKWFGKDFPQTRISFTADRPLTLFKYNGFSAEFADGIDTQTYPIPAVYTVGLSVKF